MSTRRNRRLGPLFAALGIVACSGARTAPRAPPTARPPAARVLLIADLEGTLEPCGCLSRPLGGIDRLVGRIRALRRDGVPTTIVAAGALLDPEPTDDGALALQRRLASSTLGRILDELEPARPAPGDRIDVAGVTVLVEPVGLDPTRPGGPTRTAPVDADRTVALRTASPRGAVRRGPGGLAQIELGDRGQYLGVIEIFLGPGSGWAPARLIDPRAHARLLTEIAQTERDLTVWRRRADADRPYLAATERRLGELRRRAGRDAGNGPPGPDGDRSQIVARVEEVGPELPRDPAVRALLAEHDRRVAEESRALLAAERPPPAPAGTARYVGIENCRACHEEAVAVWQRTPHAHAYRTIEDAGKEANLDCVGCHVTGYRRPGGSTAAHNEGLRDVQCEVCHGPGSRHADARGHETEPRLVRAPEATVCLECHTPEHSDRFDFRAFLPRILGPGHGR